MVSAVLMLLLTVSGAMAQEANPPGETPSRPGQGQRQRMRDERMRGERMRHEKAREMMMSLKIWKLTEALEIDETLSATLYPRVRELEDLRFEQQKEVEKTTDELKQVLESPAPDPETLARLVGELKDMRFRHAREEKARLDRIYELLTMEQQAKFILVEAEFQDTVRRFLRERQGMQGPRENRGPQGRGPDAGPGSEGRRGPGNGFD